jgi:hypothetical protein
VERVLGHLRWVLTHSHRRADEARSAGHHRFYNHERGAVVEGIIGHLRWPNDPGLILVRCRTPGDIRPSFHRGPNPIILFGDEGALPQPNPYVVYPVCCRIPCDFWLGINLRTVESAN